MDTNKLPLADAPVEAPIDPNAIAYKAIVADAPNKDGKHFRIVGAFASGGYQTMKEASAEDPLYLAKGPIWFDTYKEASDEAIRKNEAELHLSQREANRIVAASMTAGRGRR